MRTGWKRMPVSGFYEKDGWTVYRARQGMVFLYKGGDVESCAGPFNTLDDAMDFAAVCDVAVDFTLTPVH